QPRVASSTGSPNTSSAATPVAPPAFAVHVPVVIRDGAGVPPPTRTPTTTPMPTLTATPSPIPPTLTPTTTPAPISDPVLVGAGDISSCYIGNVYDEATAKLLDVITGTVFTAGDN